MERSLHRKTNFTLLKGERIEHYNDYLIEVFKKYGVTNPVII